MSAAIAHEINQPLAAMRTFMASAKIFAQRENFSQVGRNLDLIAGLAERMASITGHLKTFARKSDHGARELVKVEAAIAGTLLLLESQIAAAGVRLDLDIAPDLHVTGNTVQLEQVILNLMRNALDAVAGRPNAWIRISARAAADTVFVAVSDNGPGIAPELINRIFDPFFTTKGVGDGLGLGLSVSYGIVQDFGGRIGARNRPEGGAELTVELPRHHDAPIRSQDAIHA
jgi:two-component system C4-dicarboxylate transport sensor histidine kinase DctB